MKKIILFVLLAYLAMPINAQKIVDDFSANNFEWNELPKSDWGTAIIDKGALTITSKGANEFLNAMVGAQVSSNTAFETHCYCPLNMEQPFKIVTHVTIQALDDDRKVGLVFNYKDGGNFYVFAFDNSSVQFLRFIDNKLVGAITQGMKWAKTKKALQTWELESDGSTIKFTVDDVPVMKVRYMPLEYSGFGFWTFGKQRLTVDDVIYYQE